MADDDREHLSEKNAARLALTYIGEVLPLSRKESDNQIRKSKYIKITSPQDFAKPDRHIEVMAT